MLLSFHRWPWLLRVAGLLTGSAAPAQTPPPGSHYRAALKAQNLGRLWHADRLVFYGTPVAAVFPEPLGFIGTNYQRFSLHYTSVQQDSANPLDSD